MLKSKPEDDSRYYFILLSIPLSFGLLMNALKCGKEFFIQPGQLMPFVIGVLIWILFWQIRLRNKPCNFLHTFHHECSHAVACTVTNTDIKEFRASKESYIFKENKSLALGHVKHGSSSVYCNVFIALAPYTVPFFIIPLLTIRMLIADPFLPLIDITIGITFGFYAIEHTVSTKRCIEAESADKNRESDLAKYGIRFSLAIIILANLILMPAIVLVLHQGWLSAARHCISGFTFWIDLMILSSNLM